MLIRRILRLNMESCQHPRDVGSACVQRGSFERSSTAEQADGWCCNTIDIHLLMGYGLLVALKSYSCLYKWLIF